MRKEFAKRLHELMSENDDIILLVGDLGFGLFNEIRDDFPDRFYNVGAAETCLLDVGIGLALSGKRPVCYSITPFLLYRAFESIRTYISYEQIPVFLAGSGRGKDYLHDGISHWSDDAKSVLDTVPNVTQYWPETTEEMQVMLNEMLNNNKPAFLSLVR